MITPTRYKRTIPPTGWGGFAKKPTVGAFYDLWLKIATQNHYPGLREFDVRVTTEREEIHDMADLRGYSEPLEARGSPVNKDSSIYFESLDLKCLGRIGIAMVSSRDYGIGRRLTYVEIPFVVPAKFLNVGSEGFEISVGTLYDSEFDAQKSIQVNMAIRGRDQSKVWDDDLVGLVDRIQNKPDYTPNDLKTFQRFVEHIRQIKM